MKQTNKSKHVEAKKRIVVTRGKEPGRENKRGDDQPYMTSGNWLFDDEHTVLYIEVGFYTAET